MRDWRSWLVWIVALYCLHQTLDPRKQQTFWTLEWWRPMKSQELCSIRHMALHAAQQGNVFKARTADRIVMVFHSSNVSFFGRGFWYSQLELLQALSDCPFWFVFSSVNSIDYKQGSATPGKSNLKPEGGHARIGKNMQKHATGTCEIVFKQMKLNDSWYQAGPNPTTPHSEPERVWPVLHEPREYIRRINGIASGISHQHVLRLWPDEHFAAGLSRLFCSRQVVWLLPWMDSKLFKRLRGGVRTRTWG